jgi:dihydroflavonol-4-reductase
VLDVCRGLIALCEKGRAGDRYILANANGNLTYREIFARIADIIGARRPVGNLPKPLAMLGGYAVDLVCKLTGKSSELNSAAARMGFQPHYFTPARAVRDLGMPQSPVDGAIRRAWEWFGANGYVK